MQWHPAPNHGDGAGRWLSTASLSQSSSIAHHKRQMFGHSRAGQARGECCAQAPAAHKAQARRLGRGDATPVPFHCRSAAGISPHSRRPVLDTLLGIGLNSPAERIRAARGAFNSIAGSRANASRQSLRDKPSYQVAIAEIHHHSNLSSGLTDRKASCATKGLGNVRKVFGELRNV